ncbi:STM4014 family protein [Tenacibaculum sp. M341]|uniref:STM4014 family protein n=1 Tax=Tenacibaculum sp. M341 TaxID=2530339 RepID=UPI0010454963|nr:STM4014 family protein [Tenacibaculum sp. M341]TCI93618.1 hypothetical protein EYW44_04190 [Tenacibaculum sp. M341]
MEQHIIIAPKNSRRIQFWKSALQKELISISYIDIINHNFSLSKHTKYCIRLESAGEDFETYQQILLLACSNETERNIVLNKTFLFGQIADFNLWLKGWEVLLTSIKHLEKQYQITFINDPLDILAVFDKSKTTKHLHTNGVAVPPHLTCNSYSHLKQIMQQQQIHQVFLKPKAGSSASGVMAFRYKDEKNIQLHTTIDLKEHHLFNSLKLKRYHTEKSINNIWNKIPFNSLHIELWLPKFKHQNLNIDFRVVVINGKAEFIVPRGSKHTITNLHLGNEKLNLDSLNLTTDTIHKIKTIAEQAMSCYPKLFYAGVDVLLTPKKQVYVLEINAFGDMLLNITNKNNLTTHEQCALFFK